MRTSPRAPSRTSFSPLQRLQEPRCPAHLTTLRPRHSDAGGPRTRMSEVHWSREGRKCGGVSRRPSLPRTARASTCKKGLREGLSGRGAGSRTPWKRAVPWLWRRLLPPTLSRRRQDPGASGTPGHPAGSWAEAQRRI